jgi:hypothetical protein
VLSDRSLDVGPLWWRGAQLAWQSPNGFRHPAMADPDSEDSQGFNRSLSGFLVTCGLDHIRRPVNGHPLHGRLPFTPARLAAYGEDWEGQEAVLFCEGEITQARLGGEALRLRRRIEAPIGAATIRIRDEVENLGAEPWPQAMLYHFNIGYPAIVTGTVVGINGRRSLGPLIVPTDGDPTEAVSMPVSENGRAIVTVESTMAITVDRLALSFSYDTATLPYLQLWHDLRPRSSILAVEPCTTRPQ